MNRNFQSEKRRIKNTGDLERRLSVLGGSALLGYALIKRSKFSLPVGLLGTAGLYRGVTGHCPFYEILGYSRADAEKQNMIRGITVQHSIVVDRPVDQVYQEWRNLQNISYIFQHLESVEPLDDTRSRWTAAGDNQVDPIMWESEIIFERKNRLIAWRSLPGYDLENQTVVEFEPDQEKMRTEILFQTSYTLPAGQTETAKNRDLYQHLFKMSPESEIKEDLKRYQRSSQSSTF
jgi:uncharacterized membrane protein